MQNLSVSDLMSLDAGFHTAREDQGDSDEESELEKTKDLQEDAALDKSKSFSKSSTEAGPAIGEPRWRPPERAPNYPDELSQQLSKSRLSRRDQLIMSRSRARQLKLLRQQTLSSNALNDEMAEASRERVLSADEFGANNDDLPNVTILMNAAGHTKETCGNSLLEHYQASNKLGMRPQERSRDSDRDSDYSGAIRIKIDSCFSLDQASDNCSDHRQSICEQEPFKGPEVPKSGTRDNSRLETTRQFLNEISNILAVPVAPPPTRASSEVDFEKESAEAKQPLANQKVGDAVDPILRSNSLMQLDKPVLGSSANMSSTSEILLGVQHTDAGSLSDNSYKLTKYCSSKRHPFEKKQFEERFKNWKKSNKIITNIHENPFNIHMDCLDRLNQLESTLTQTSSQMLGNQHEGEIVHVQDHKQPGAQFGPPEGTEMVQHQQLNHYANHLTYVYKRNQEIMDSNCEFRTLLYNIICCLLVQDDQVLATPSVGKMLEVIRTHLDSASKVYSDTSSLLLNPNLAPLSETPIKPPEQQRADGWAEEVGADIIRPSVSDRTTCSKPSDSHDKANSFERGPASNQLRLPDSSFGSRAKKPADFRRISSVSYNDEQLIHDLCDDHIRAARASGQRSGSLTSASTGTMNHGAQRDCWSPSPWAYQELSDRPCSSSCANNSAGSGASQTLNTSQSSLEQMPSACGKNQCAAAAGMTTDSNQSDPMNDSGNGTMYEFQIASDFGVGLRSSTQHHGSSLAHRTGSLCSDSFIGGLGKLEGAQDGARSLGQRRLSDFKPQQQPSYMSTDDYLSSTNNNYNNRTSFYEDENSSTLQKFDCMSASGENQSLVEQDNKCADIAARRSELEWTLNKLINIELKHTWLTSQDTLRRAIRKIGVPNEIRGKVWLILIDQMIGTKYNLPKILEEARQTIEDEDEDKVVFDEETQATLKQIELDVNRTMPGHRLFDDGAEGGVKLRRILVAYSIHVNPAIAYCQGFNFIVALLLSVFEGDEEKALSGFICIVDHIFPSKYYFDHYLTGARADQFLLADFICDQLIKNPTMADRKMVEGVTSSITLNWFISLFHGAVPTLTRLTILDHFMLEGVKALFRFTMAILYLAFQVTPPSSCEVFQTIRNTAKEMYDIKLLLSIVGQIKLPKDSYFAIRRSFYMVQSSFNSDQFYMQTLSSEASRVLASNKPLSVQQLPDTKPPALSLISSSSTMTNLSGSSAFTIRNSVCSDTTLKQQQQSKPRICTSANRSKVCIQSLGKLGRSHLRVIDTNARSNERSLMSPLRNCLIIGISNCGKNLTLARQSSKRNYRTFREQDLNFHIHELHNEIFDGFYLEDQQLAIILTHQAEILKVDTTKCSAGLLNLDECTETLMLRENNSLADHEKVKLRLCTIDSLTNLLWIYVECEDSAPANSVDQHEVQGVKASDQNMGKFKSNNPYLAELCEISDDQLTSKTNQKPGELTRAKQPYSRKIIIVDIVTFDLFSAFAVSPNFGEITNLRASLVAFCQLLNPASNQFSTRILQIGPTGRYEQLLSFSDVVDYMISVSEAYKRKYIQQSSAKACARNDQNKGSSSQRYSTLKRLLSHSMSFHQQQPDDTDQVEFCDNQSGNRGGAFTKYYRSLLRSYSTAMDIRAAATIEHTGNECKSDRGPDSSVISQSKNDVPKLIQDAALRSIVASSFGNFSELSETNYIPVNMAFIFRNGKIALFEFTESYAIHTREAQLDRYDYSKVIDVSKNGEDFIVTILTVFDKLIKVVI